MRPSGTIVVSLAVTFFCYVVGSLDVFYFQESMLFMKDLLKLIPKYTAHEATSFCTSLLAKRAGEDNNIDYSEESDGVVEMQGDEQSARGEYVGGIFEYSNNSLLGWVALTSGSSAKDLELR